MLKLKGFDNQCFQKYDQWVKSTGKNLEQYEIKSKD